MKNDLIVEVEGYVENEIGTLCVSYIDTLDNVVGYFDVNKKGVMHFFVDESDYKSQIVKSISKVADRDVSDSVDQLDYYLSEDKTRWDRAKKYIEDNNFEIKYREDKLMDYDEQSVDSNYLDYEKQLDDDNQFVRR